MCPTVAELSFQLLTSYRRIHRPDHYVRPEFTYVREPSYSFGIGSSGSGVPFHTHGAVFAEVLHGHKRWFLARPGKKPAFSPDQTSLYWVTEILPTLNNTADILDCTLGPGEVRSMANLKI